MIEKILVYEDFYKAGTTALLRNVFNNPLDYEVDTVFINVKHEDVDIFEFALNNADVKKHKQVKINVDLALYNRQNERCTFTKRNVHQK